MEAAGAQRAAALPFSVIVGSGHGLGGYLTLKELLDQAVDAGVIKANEAKGALNA